MKKIPLTRNKCALIDSSDYARISNHNWHFRPNGYAAACIKGRQVLMHRFIMNTPDGLDTDHINSDGLDNRRSNLRVCSHAVNLQNRVTKSGHRGYIYKQVTKSKSHIYTYFRGRIQLFGTRYYTSLFKTEIEARDALDSMILSNNW